MTSAPDGRATDNKTVARQVLERIGRYDFEAALELLSPDAIWSEFGRVHHTKDQLRPALEFLKSRIDGDGIHIVIGEVIAEGERVAVTAEETATTVDGTEYANAFTFWFTVRDGAITAVNQYHDSHMVVTTLRPGEGGAAGAGGPLPTR